MARAATALPVRHCITLHGVLKPPSVRDNGHFIIFIPLSSGGIPWEELDPFIPFSAIYPIFGTHRHRKLREGSGSLPEYPFWQRDTHVQGLRPIRVAILLVVLAGLLVCVAHTEFTLGAGRLAHVDS